MPSRISGPLVALALALSTGHAQGEEIADADRATARALAADGQTALEAGEFERALDFFTRANAIVVAPTLQVGIGQAQVGLGLLVEARETLSRVLRAGVPPGSPPSWREALDEATTLVVALEPRVARMTVVVSGASNARVTVDGVPMPPGAIGRVLLTNPGSRDIRATAPGYGSSRKTVQLAEGSRVTVELELAPVSSPTPRTTAPIGPTADAPANPAPPVNSTRDAISYVALGVGAVGLAVGSAAGILAIAKKADLDDACPNGKCPPSERGLIDSYRTAGAISTVGFVAAAAGFGAALTLQFTGSSADVSHEPPVHAFVGLGSVGARGSF